MKDRSRIDVMYAVVLIAIVSLSIYSVIDIEARYQLISIALLLVVNGFLVSIYMFNSYEMNQEALEIRFGVLKESVRYELIKELSIEKNYWSSMALSRRRIKIRYNYKGRFLTTTYISPLKLDEFYQALKAKSKLT